MKKRSVKLILDRFGLYLLVGTEGTKDLRFFTPEQAIKTAFEKGLSIENIKEVETTYKAR